ncbi:hypothetical protein ACIQ4I_02245 [Rummeliibacillus sp. NPDC094406]|uniref:hypothetical protein n=1 Tax=Rummeliibacillus sp. NPDC094406 TaxID=3364511 RepID=UPI00380F8261
MIFVFITLILSLALIPLVLIDIKIKVSETQYDLAIRSLELPEETLSNKAQNRMNTKQRLSKLKLVNWNKIQTKLNSKYLKKILISGYTLILDSSKSLKRKMKESWDKMHHLRKSKNNRTNRSINNQTTRSAKR